MSRRPRTASVLAALTVLLLAPFALAEAGGEPIVIVSIVGDGGDAVLEASLRELLSRLHLTMSAAAEPTSAAPLARVQIDLTSSSQAIVIVTDGRTGEVRARRVLPRDSSAAITREEIAHAVQSAVESALLVDERPAPAPAPAEPVPPPPAPSPPPAVVVSPPPVTPAPREEPPAAPPPWLALDLMTLAGAGPFADGVGPVVRLGGGAQLRSRGVLRPSIALTGFYAVPFQSEGSFVGSSANLVSLRAIPAVEIARTSWLALDVGAGGGVDTLSVQPVQSRSTDLPPSNLRPSTVRWDAIASGVVSARAALATSVVFVLQTNVDVDFTRSRYAVDEGEAQPDVFEPWRVRPTVLVGLAFTALGEGLFSSRVAMQEGR